MFGADAARASEPRIDLWTHLSSTIDDAVYWEVSLPARLSASQQAGFSILAASFGGALHPIKQAR
jgi:hypothetical protein